MPEELELNIEQLPFSMEAEQSVLGAILVEPECIAKVLELLTPGELLSPAAPPAVFHHAGDVHRRRSRSTLSPCWRRQRPSGSLPATRMPRST